MIFISYSTKDSDLAERIKGKLEEKQYPCFLSGYDLEADDDWHKRIWEGLRTCHAFLGLVTPDFNGSAFCQQELGAALAFDKPRLLILRKGVSKPPGFAARFQKCKTAKLLETLETNARFRTVRVAAWINAVRSVDSFRAANEVHDRFSGEWTTMTEGEKLCWLLSAARNSQVEGEMYKSGRFVKMAKKELKAAMTDQWLLENDTEGFLHDPEKNPLAS